MQRRGQQTRLLFGEDVDNDAAAVARPWSAMSDLIAPLPSLPVAFGQRREGPPGPERIADIANGALHAALLIARAHLTRLGSEVVMGAQLDQARVEENVCAAAFQHSRLEVVVENGARLSVPSLEGMHVTAQKVLGALIEEELEIDGARIRQRHHKTGKSALRAADADMAEVSPIDLPLLAGKHVELQKRFANLRTQAGHRAAQLHDAAGVAAVADHLVDAGGAQARMLIESLADELGIGMDAQFTGDGADLPVFGVEVAADLGADFGAEHDSGSPSSGNRRKRIDVTARTAANPATQPQTGAGFRRGLHPTCGKRFTKR